MAPSDERPGLTQKRFLVNTTAPSEERIGLTQNAFQTARSFIKPETRFKRRSS
jgi:hypothetical protein